MQGRGFFGNSNTEEDDADEFGYSQSGNYWYI